jgi:hypothetical protein
MIDAVTFFSTLNWIDGSPLVIEPYRKEIFRKSLDTYRYDGVPQFTLALAGRGKKNNKSLDLILAGIYCLMFREDPRGSDVLIVANDKDQADQDLDLAKKLIAANPDLAEELEVLADEIRRKDGRGTMRVLPANNVVGQHGKTACFVGFDEVHAYRDHALLEALAPDPTRYCLTWITSYDSIFDTDGYPLHDLKKIGIAGTDDRMLFSWYSGDLCTDPAFANLEPELRANPSMGSWPEGRGHLEQQRRRLPSSQFRRLHLNLPGAPKGAFFDQGIVERAIVAGRQVIEPQDGVDYLAFVDMSGGSSDDATLGIAHWNGEKAVLDVLISQGDAPPFNPRLAVASFAVMCKRYRCHEVHGDAYAGQTFRHDFADCGVDYIVEKQTRTDLYENLEVALNAGQVELLDLPKLRRELMTIVQRGASLDHMSGQHDDWATSAAGALTLVNPDIGNTTPSILTFYKRQVQAVLNVPPPAPALESPVGARPANHVRVIVPGEPSHLFAASGVSYLVEIEDDQRVAYVDPDDAREIVNSPLSVAFFELNADLRAQLGTRAAQPRGIRWADWLQAAEDQRPIDFTNKGAVTRQTLEMLRRAR